jgi:putative flippase GtrA
LSRAVGKGAVFLRFVVVNVLNTFLYWGLYLLLLLVMPYVWANAVALGIAILAAYVANARYAFRVRASRRSLWLFLMTNGTTMALRTAVVWLLVEHLSLPEQLAPPVAVVVTLPLAFGLTSLVMTDRPRSAAVAPTSGRVHDVESLGEPALR